MAEFLLKHLVRELGQEHAFEIASSGTSAEELGNSVHPGTVKRLKQAGVSVSNRTAVQLTKADYAHYDYLLCMDAKNVKNAKAIIGSDDAGKLMRLLDFSDKPRDIADPWYTGNYDATFIDIFEGLESFLSHHKFIETNHRFLSVTR